MKIRRLKKFQQEKHGHMTVINSSREKFVSNFRNHGDYSCVLRRGHKHLRHSSHRIIFSESRMGIGRGPWKN